MSARQTDSEFTTENLLRYEQKFKDRIRVYVRGGKGGRGIVAFEAENYGSKLPAGGSGGDGGSVIFEAN